MADSRDIIGGVGLAAIGGFFFAGSFRYGIGTMRNMGAGFFPMALGAGVFLSGAAIGVRGLVGSGAIALPAARPLIANLAAIAGFALTIRPLGLIPAIILTAIISATGERQSRPWPTIVFAVLLAVGVWAVFVPGLGLNIPGIRGIL